MYGSHKVNATTFNMYIEIYIYYLFNYIQCTIQLSRYTTYDLKINIEVKSQSGAVVYLEPLHVFIKF